MLWRASDIEAEFRGMQLRINELYGSIASLQQSGGSSPVLTPPNPTPQIQASNQIRNGDMSHSNGTWNEVTTTNADSDKECAWWYSHDAPTAGQHLDSKTNYSNNGVDNKTLKYTGHAFYSSAKNDWDRPNGWARLVSTKSLDALLPQNYLGPDKTVYIKFIMARARAAVKIPQACRVYAGIWDNTAGSEDWLSASTAYTLSGSVIGTPASTTERRYKVYARTDRGYDALSTELTLAAAPADGSYVPNQVYVTLSWTPIQGVLSYDVYRHDITAGDYKLLKQVSSGALTYDDQNTYEASGLSGYPTPVTDRAKAYYATNQGVLTALAVNGVDGRWDSISLPVHVPSNYNVGATTDRQWLRVGLTVAPDLEVMDAVTNSTTTVTSATAAFTADMNGLTAHVSDATHEYQGTITYVNATTITLSGGGPTWTGTGNRLFIEGGALHEVFIDLVHASFGIGAIFALHPDDRNRPQQPISTPNGSSQGGVDPPDTGGHGNCVRENQMICLWRGNDFVQRPFRDIHINDLLGFGHNKTFVQKKTKATVSELLRLRTANGFELECTPKHRLITSSFDSRGKEAERFQKGDEVLTLRNGVCEVSKIVRIESIEGTFEVGTFHLQTYHLFIAGAFVGNWKSRIMNKLKRFFGIKVNDTIGGICQHNVKVE